ncbi:hypothetical protein B0T16DRAFT_414207 [Cercophora newfieldiana]|uniref:Uncharacterized protein n=1 Tax=Cercophora newfieldiana TaxID=92897 RepID=A0AA39Y660_9PEZI|nr:hypothetical protein B0T16DRAFT_414207 [Cercophora newfieldiana]
MGFWENLSKSIDQFIDFDPDAYRREIESLGEAQQVQRKLVNANFGAGISTAAAPSLWDIPLVLTDISVRRIDINQHRLEIINARLREKGWRGNSFDMGDVFVALAPTAIGHVVAPRADLLVDQAMEHIAEQLVVHHGTNHVIEQAANHIAPMAGDHGAGADRLLIVDGTDGSNMANEAMYKMTHTHVERLAEKGGEVAVHKVSERGAKMAMRNVAGLAVDNIKASSWKATDKPIAIAPPSQSHGSTSSTSSTTNTPKPPQNSTLNQQPLRRHRTSWSSQSPLPSHIREGQTTPLDAPHHQYPNQKYGVDVLIPAFLTPKTQAQAPHRFPSRQCPRDSYPSYTQP